MIKIEEIIGVGQLNKGDMILIEDSNGTVFPSTVKEVYYPKTTGEEVIISSNKNRYFIMCMYLAGESWVKRCSKVINGKIFSVSNTTEVYPLH